MSSIIKFIHWVFEISYRDTTLKHKNIPDNAIFFISFLYTNLVGCCVNIFFSIFILFKIPPYFYLILYICIFIISKFFFLRKQNINRIEKKNPNKKDMIKLNMVFLISVILFFSSLIFMYNKYDSLP